MRIVVLRISLSGLSMLLASISAGAIVNVSTQLNGNKLDLTSIELSQTAPLANRVLTFDQLWMPLLIDYRSVPESNAANTVTIFGTPDATPPTGNDRLALVSDAARIQVSLTQARPVLA